MKTEQDRAAHIEEIAERAQRGEDVSQHFSGDHVAKQRIDIDLPLSFLRLIDEDCKRLGISRQAWIKMACNERLRQAERTSDLAKAS